MLAKVVATSTNEVVVSSENIGYCFCLLDVVDISRFVQKRTLKSNSFLFALYEFIIDNGGRKLGHFSTSGLHLNMKLAYEAENPQLAPVSTSKMEQDKFNEFIEFVDGFAVCELQIDTSEFFKKNNIEG